MYIEAVASYICTANNSLFLSLTEVSESQS